MVAGDIVNAVYVGTGGDIDFQPAVNVSICITNVGVWNSYVQITNGIVTAYILDTTASGLPNTKIMINNTNYLRLFAIGGGGAFYSGIQIK